ncbi:MAG: HAD family hydrolase, partial [Eubacteriales bacterium]|nr:HAD family hydrolase [Eubacteriales bacterium]
ASEAPAGAEANSEAAALAETETAEAASAGDPAKSEPFTFQYWEDGAPALSALTEYVDAVTDPANADFIPVEDRLAVFDMDGTIIAELDPMYFDYTIFCHRILDDPDYKDIAAADMVQVASEIREKSANGIPRGYEITHSEMLARAFAGMTIEEFKAYVLDFAEKDAQGFEGMKRVDSFYKPMLEVIKYLEENDFTVYIVSGTDVWICRALLSTCLDLPENQIIGSITNLVASGQGEKGMLDYVYAKEDEMVRGDTFITKAIKMNKNFLIEEHIGQTPVLAFGNSSGDFSMLRLCTNNTEYRSESFFVIADDAERDYGKESNRETYIPQMEESGWHYISMRDDWTTIYGENVVKITETAD